MAKRAPQGEKPFTAIDKSLAMHVMEGSPAELLPELVPSSESSRAAPTIVESVERRTSETENRSRSPSRDIAISRDRAALRRDQLDGSTMEKLTREKRILMSSIEEREIERCVDRIAEAFQSPVKLSHIVRACLSVLMNAEDRVIARAQETGPLTRPANGNTLALVEFEHQVAKALSLAFRDAAPLK